MKKTLSIFCLVSSLLLWTNSSNAWPLLFEDNFDGGDNYGWITTLGAWDASSGKNVVIGTDPLCGTQMAYTYAGEPSWKDYTFESDITFGTGDTEFYLAVRANPDSSLSPGGGEQYYLSVDGDNDLVRLRYTSEPDVFVRLDQVPYTLLEQTTYHVQITIVENTLQAWIDGTPLFDYTFSGAVPDYTCGLIGIGYKSNEGADGAYFDNVVVNAITQPVPEPATIFLVGFGLAGLTSLRRKFRK